MHITIQHVGPLAGLTVNEIDAIVARVWDTGLVTPARPVASLHQLWNTALTASHEMVGDRLPSALRMTPSGNFPKSGE
jgi:hypothetical protein